MTAASRHCGGVAVAAQGWHWRHAGRSQWALSDVDFTIEPGERVLLLGSSGSGKSTLLQGIAGLLDSTEDGDEAGFLRVDGVPPAERRNRIGMVLQDPDSQVILSRVGDDVAFGMENLNVEREKIWPRVRRALSAVGLELPLARDTSMLSGGQQQRLALAGVLAMNPGLILLDEPTANLDPTVRRDVVELIREARDEGKTILFSSHVLSEVEDVCDRVLVLKAGRLVDTVRVVDVRRQHRIQAALTGPLSPLPPQLTEDIELQQDGEGGVTVISRGELAPLLGWLANQPLAKLQIEPIGLRSVYERHHPATNGDE